MRLRDLNRLLDDNGLALSNMGGYDAQTVAGVMSTSTHGSGSRSARSPTPSARSSSWRVIRIERAGGLPIRIDAGAQTTMFNAAVVGMGCMGVIYAATIEVEPEYWLTEVRELSTWAKQRDADPRGAAGQPPLRGVPEPLSARGASTAASPAGATARRITSASARPTACAATGGSSSPAARR